MKHTCRFDHLGCQSLPGGGACAAHGWSGAPLHLLSLRRPQKTSPRAWTTMLFLRRWKAVSSISLKQIVISRNLSPSWPILGPLNWEQTCLWDTGWSGSGRKWLRWQNPGKNSVVMPWSWDSNKLGGLCAISVIKKVPDDDLLWQASQIQSCFPIPAATALDLGARVLGWWL